MDNFYLKAGALLGAISVAIGAFGAHFLKPILLASNRIETFDSAVKYQFYGAFALLVIGLLPAANKNKFSNIAGNLFLIGTIIFSGSLHLICTTGITLFGAIAPIGGICLISGWLFLFYSIIFANKTS
jgi:uncharacterized membrane protein YgdD (TMEM256/DUF423 family)